MKTTQQNIASLDQESQQVQVHLEEYVGLREEITLYISGQDQRLVLALGSASVAIPLLVGQTQNIPINILASLLYILAIVYAVLGMNYASGIFAIAMIGKYIHEHIEPELNRIVRPPANHPILHWETFLRKERRNTLNAILIGAGASGCILLLLLPASCALLAAQYVLALPAIQGGQQSPALEFVSSLLVPVSIVAWCAYFIDVGSFVILAWRLRNLTFS